MNYGLAWGSTAVFSFIGVWICVMGAASQPADKTCWAYAITCAVIAAGCGVYSVVQLVRGNPWEGEK